MFKRVGWVLLAAVAVGVSGASQTAPQTPQPVQPSLEMREFIPLPSPDSRRPQPQQGECEPVILFYHEGRLYQLKPGPKDGRGSPGAPPEFYEMKPYQAPPPSSPNPRS